MSASQLRVRSAQVRVDIDNINIGDHSGDEVAEWRHGMTNGHRDDQRWTNDGLYYEYSKAVNPARGGPDDQSPDGRFSPRPSRERADADHSVRPEPVAQMPGSCHQPALCSNFIRIIKGEHVRTTPNATSELYYVIRGKGRTTVHGEDIRWSKGDFLALPAKSEARPYCRRRRGLLLGRRRTFAPLPRATATMPRFKPTLYPSARAVMELEKVENDPEASRKSRVSVLLANKAFPQTRTITQ